MSSKLISNGTNDGTVSLQMARKHKQHGRQKSALKNHSRLDTTAPIKRRTTTDSQTRICHDTRNIGLYRKCETRRVDDASKRWREMGSQSRMETKTSSRELQTKKRTRGSSPKVKHPEMDTTGFRPIKHSRNKAK